MKDVLQTTKNQENGNITPLCNSSLQISGGLDIYSQLDNLTVMKMTFRDTSKTRASYVPQSTNCFGKLYFNMH